MGKRLSRFITHYRTKYFYTTAYNPYDFRLIPGADEKIYAAIDDIIMHKSADEIELPPLTFTNIVIELPPVARKMYDDMKKELVSEYGDDEVIWAANNAVQSAKLKQIANGTVYNEDRDIVEVHDAKLEALDSLVEELGGRPLLVIYEYLHDLARLKHAYPKAPSIGGQPTQNELWMTIDAWNRGEIPVLLLHPKSGGHGLNLQDGGCRDICWYSITFDYELYQQAIQRVWRQGVKNSVIVHHIIANKTIDERIVEKVLVEKAEVQMNLLNAMRK
jgi:SNF2 family DNA or RNA helicase